jgi:hypothetical protein
MPGVTVPVQVKLAEWAARREDGLRLVWLAQNVTTDHLSPWAAVQIRRDLKLFGSAFYERVGNGESTRIRVLDPFDVKIQV